MRPCDGMHGQTARPFGNFNSTVLTFKKIETLIGKAASSLGPFGTGAGGSSYNNCTASINKISREKIRALNSQEFSYDRLYRSQAYFRRAADGNLPNDSSFGRARLLPSWRRNGWAGASPSRVMNWLVDVDVNMFAGAAPLSR